MKTNPAFAGRLFSLVAVATFFCLFTSCKSHKFGFPPPEGKKLYISQNFWYEKPQKFYALNYKRGHMLPAGTEVTSIQYSKDEIRFFVPSLSHNFRMTYRDKYQGGMPPINFVERLFTTKNLEELTKGFTQKEKEFVRDGILRAGISKSAVLVGYGYPPAHQTPTLDGNRWIYWTSRLSRQELMFDDKGMLISFR
ncbi:MAG: hypothetical protein PHV82_16865 [Victivallaceae bacterium]|nr:hypothetical protein [Victivallaceae bacterium]